MSDPTGPLECLGPLEYEVGFWGDCLDTFGEERKHYVYASLMGIDFDLGGRSVLDIGGGPVSMLLKCRARGATVVLDPLMHEFPAWVRARYAEARIEAWAIPAEILEVDHRLDEAWIYNVLQHVIDPQRVVMNARASARMVRIFEWVGLPAYAGHPHTLEPAKLDEWLGGHGIVQALDQDGCVGTAYFGAFPS